MKKNYVMLTVFFFLLFGKAHSQWTNVDFSTYLDVLQDVCFTDANTGFIAGYIDDNVHNYSRIYRTTNGGTSWTKVFETTDPSMFSGSGKSHSLHSFYFTSANNGFCVGGRDGLYPFICKTTNGGVTWDTLSFTQTTFTAVNVYFPSANVGYICGDVAVSNTGLLKTTNAGTTWVDITAAAATAMDYTAISSMYFLNDNTGFACTKPSSSVQAAIYKTTDGGSSWTKLYSLTNNEGFFSLQFVNSTTGFAAVTSGLVYKTIDGGINWTPIPLSLVQLNVYDVHFFTSQLGYAASGQNVFSGGIYKTTNGGTSWTLDNSGNYVISNYYSLSFSQGKGYACGISGYSKNNAAPQGIDDQESNNQEFSVYPNPANEIIELSAPQNSQIEILNIEGQIIKSIIADENKTTVDVSNFVQGMYFVKVKTGNGIGVRKFVKE